MSRTRIELEEHLSEQLHFLRASCDAFDEGRYAEHKRIAQTLRILLYDAKPSGRKQARTSKSLLTQLNIKEKLQYRNTADIFSPTNLVSHHGLVYLQIEFPEIATYVPSLGDAPVRTTRTSFQLWWDEIVLSEPNQLDGHKQLSRGEVILHVANTDGGAHIDEELGEAYLAFARNNALGWMMGDPEKPEIEGIPMGNPIPATVRQIAYELLETLRVARMQVFKKTEYTLSP